MFRLINGFNDEPYTVFIMGILGIITIQKSHSLFSHMLFLNPKFNKLRKLIHIHKLYIVNVPILLSFNDDTWRNTFITHSFRVRLMILTSLIYLISNLRRGKAVTTFDFCWMNSFTF